jgi:hypothetical protein
MHEYNTSPIDIERDNFAFAHGMDFQNTLKIEIMDTVYISRTISSSGAFEQEEWEYRKP